MPLYAYKALNKKGLVVEDTIQATNKKDAAAILQGNDLKVLTLKSLEGEILIGAGISVSEKANFCRFMSMMMRSGLPLPEAVEIIRRESKNRHMQKILADVSFQTRKGRSLSSVLAQYKNDFDSVFLTIVSAGEQSGTLDKAFDYLAKQLLASYEFSQKVKGALMYPIIIIMAMIGEGFLMMFFILPKLSTVFLSLNIKLPVATKIILDVGKFVGENTLLVLGASVFTLATGVFSFVYPSTRRLIMLNVGKFPAISKMMNEIDIARFSRTLAILLKSGVPIIHSLDVSANSLTQPKWHEAAKTFSGRVAKGESLSDVLLDEKIKFPAVLAQAIRTGEETGSMDIVLEELADFYEKEVDYSLKRVTSIIEPVLMLIVGVAVGAMVILMITPIYSIVGGLDNSL